MHINIEELKSFAKDWQYNNIHIDKSRLTVKQLEELRTELNSEVDLMYEDITEIIIYNTSVKFLYNDGNSIARKLSEIPEGSPVKLYIGHVLARDREDKINKLGI